MPKIKTSRVKYPGGWELIEPTIRELDAKMREGMTYAPLSDVYWYFCSYMDTNIIYSCSWKWHTWWEEKVRSPLANFPYFPSKKSLYDLYYRRKEISKELYEFCLDQGYADRNLIAKWKKVSIWPMICECPSFLILCASLVRCLIHLV